jgi:hypothetical protein
MKSWTQFTKQNIKQFQNNKYNLDNDNILLNNIKSERKRIIDFIKSNPKLKVQSTELNEKEIHNLDNKINSYSNTTWTDKKGIINELPNLIYNYKITWKTLNNNNIIYIKTSLDITNILKKSKHMIYIIEYLRTKSTDSSAPITIYLVLTQLVKYFPTKQTINKKHVNSGYTDSLNNYIFIWRYEEFEKVLFHEVVHFFNLENRELFNKILFDINGPHNYFEAITDFYGIFYHLIYLNLITNISIKLLLELELTFIKNQAMILNNYFNLGNWTQRPNITINQQTPAFSYYIIKYLIFEHFLHNPINNDYYQILLDSVNNRFVQQPYIKMFSDRMTLLQLN